jgi:DNA-binding CsgD family transcriptional regulator
MNSEEISANDRTHEGSRLIPVAVVVFAAIALLIAWDVAIDYRAGTERAHLISETAVMLLALAGATALTWQLRSSRRLAKQLTVDLAAARREAAQFREEAQTSLRGLAEAIDRQFERWKLSAAEREVALLLLKGLSHKEVASVRSTSETTIRQQAQAIYRKSGLRSRSELSAFFLEDLLLPSSER